MINKFDIVDFIINFEGGMLKDEDVIEGFQYLINDGSVWKLQGMYGRMAESLIEQGLCKKKNKWTPEEAKNNFRNYI